MSATRSGLLGGAALLAGLAGCGDAPEIPEGTHWLPVAVGNVWVYEESGGSLPGTVTKSIEATETHRDRTTFVMTTTQTNSVVDKRSNWWIDGARVTRLRQQRLNALGELLNYREYDPGFLRLDGALAEVGDEVEETHERSEYDASGGLLEAVQKTYTWSVEAAAEEVTVPAGTFTCLRVHRIDADVGEKTYWYADGIGKVLETDGVEQEALTDYTVVED